MSTSQDRECIELLHGMGDLYRRSGQPQRALVMLLIAIQLAPTNSALLHSLVLAFTDSGDTDRAIAALDRLVEQQGESAALLLLRSRALWKAGRKDDARQCFRRYLEARRAAQ
ncbi:tetratricopeptide repeat protein [Pseudomonas sp. RGM 3321]|uniref:type III secretion apparatus assembly chaperone SctY n=1 Tax=Pseudomonas sp. RGM 3321 TaxID=2930089 RepID=UPI001FCAE678|nr:tetratricopeptide repeat protein [Pseudomonas sp. RGM 3321]MCJ2371993.1 tetratricopeptide repeat protein [Pseudomonas sp. RGM 3321]